MFKHKFVQRKKTGVFVYLIVSISFFLISTTLAAAQDYPEKPITIYSGFRAGGNVSMSSQVFADHAKKYLPNPQSFVLSYKTGAGSAIAADYVLAQPADGYSLFVYTGDLSIKLALEGPKLNFTKDDFIPIESYAQVTMILPVNKESPFKTVEEFIDYARKNPGKLSYGTAGVGGAMHMAGELLQNRCGIKLKHVPFAGGAEGVPALLGKHIDTFLGVASGPMLQQILPGGGLRLLAVFARERLPAFPEVPTLLEKGYDVEFGSWFGLVAPKGTPPQVLEILQKVFQKTAEDSEVKKKLSGLGNIPLNWGPQETRKAMDRYYVESRETFLKLGLIK